MVNANGYFDFLVVDVLLFCLTVCAMVSFCLEVSLCVIASTILGNNVDIPSEKTKNMQGYSIKLL